MVSAQGDVVCAWGDLVPLKGLGLLIVVVGNGWRRHDEIAAGTFCQGPFCLCQVVAAGLGAGVVGAQYPLADCQGLAVHLDGSLVVAGGVIAVAQASPAAEGIGVVGAKGSGAALQSFPGTSPLPCRNGRRRRSCWPDRCNCAGFPGGQGQGCVPARRGLPDAGGWPGRSGGRPGESGPNGS